MASWGNTIINYEHVENADLPNQLEAIATLARLLELVECGMKHENEHGLGSLDADDDLRHSIAWPLRLIAEKARDRVVGKVA